MSTVHMLKKSVRLHALFDILGWERPDISDVPIQGVCGLSAVGPGLLSFSKKVLSECPGGAVFAPVGSPDCIKSDNPRRDFVVALDYLYRNIGIDYPNAAPIIAEDAQIHPTVTLENDTVVGAGSVIAPGAVIRRGTIIGENCYIGPNAVIGDAGLGFERNEEGISIRFHQIAGVQIGNFVEVGGLCTIANGTLADTIIEDHVKLDNLVNVGHNAKVGRGTMAAANSSLGGSSQIGEDVWVSPGAQVKNAVKVGDRAFIGIGSIVIKNVKPDTKVFGNPARKI